MLQKELHGLLLKKMPQICDWFKEQTSTLEYPIYSSYDIRDAGYKITNVDANIYPAGFNNICPADKESSVIIVKKYLDKHYSSNLKRVLIITEEHTQNPFYWENVYTINNLLFQAGYQVKIGFAREFSEPLTMQSATGQLMTVYPAHQSSPIWEEFNPELILSNNDFSDPHVEWVLPPDSRMNPPREMGWYQRKKSRYFKHFNAAVAEFSRILEIDPFVLQVYTEVFEEFDINSESSRAALAKRVDLVMDHLNVEYKKRNIDQKPFVFIKNNAGTYGLGVTKVNSGQEIIEWSYKNRKKMKAAKGGREIAEVIIQEGIPSIVQSDGASAEPVIYMIGCDLAGGFLRTHSEKSSTESLNSPGAIYKRLCVSDLEVRPEGCLMENVYGWSAKLGLLAIGLESREMNVSYSGFLKASCGS